MKQEINILTEFIEKFIPIFHITNDVQNKYTFTVDKQNRVGNTPANAAGKVGLKKLAIILPAELITELSIEQTVISELGFLLA